MTSVLRQRLRNQQLTRSDGLRLAYFMMHAELEGMVCSGPRRGKHERAERVRQMRHEFAEVVDSPHAATNMTNRLPVYTSVTGGAVGVAAASTMCEETSGDRLSTLFEIHYPRLYRLARRMAETADDARDLVQETFLRAARSPSSVPRGHSAEEAWLVRVMVNVCRDGWRKRAGRRRLDELHLLETRGLALASPEAALVAHTTVWRALQELSPRRRAAVVLYELEGVSIKDIAHLLDVSAVTVRWHLSRGRHDLSRIISGRQES